ncbi:MAG: hypothetical protein WAW80_00595 [Candidatus Saccharimonadales bacterium]
MIPYIDFRTNNHFDRIENPFENSTAKLTVLLDSKTLSESDINFIFSLNDGINVEVISTYIENVKSHQLSEGQERDDNLHFTLRDDKKETLTHYAVLGLTRINQTSSTLADQYGTEKEIFDSIVLSSTAQSIGAHILVTNNTILLDNKDKGIINKVNPLGPNDTIALIGLLRRSRNIFDTILESDEKVTLRNGHAKWTFFWAASREYIAQGWEFVSSTNQISVERPRELSLALHSRLSNVLKCRDEIQKSLLIKQSNDSVENAIFYFEYYLLNVTATFDILARIIDEIYKPIDAKSKRIKNISWRNGWRNSLSKVEPNLSSIMDKETISRDVLEFAATLRNYIHGEGLLGSQHSVNGKVAPVLIQIPLHEVKRLKPVIERLWKNRLGDQYLTSESIMLDIGMVVEELTPSVIAAINRIIGAIDFSVIENFDSNKVKGEPDDWYARNDKVQILRQIGLGHN